MTKWDCHEEFLEYRNILTFGDGCDKVRDKSVTNPSVLL